MRCASVSGVGSSWAATPSPSQMSRSRSWPSICTLFSRTVARFCTESPAATVPRLPSTTLYEVLPESECVVVALGHACAYSAAKRAGVPHDALAAHRASRASPAAPRRAANVAACRTSWGCRRPHWPHPLRLVGLPMTSLLTAPHGSVDALRLVGLPTPSFAAPRRAALPTPSVLAAPHGAIDALTCRALRPLLAAPHRAVDALALRASWGCR